MYTPMRPYACMTAKLWILPAKKWFVNFNDLVFLGKKVETIVLSRKHKAFRLEFPFDQFYEPWRQWWTCVCFWWISQVVFLTRTTESVYGKKRFWSFGVARLWMTFWQIVDISKYITYVDVFRILWLWVCHWRGCQQVMPKWRLQLPACQVLKKCSPQPTKLFADRTTIISIHPNAIA